MNTLSQKYALVLTNFLFLYFIQANAAQEQRSAHTARMPLIDRTNKPRIVPVSKTITDRNFSPERGSTVSVKTLSSPRIC